MRAPQKLSPFLQFLFDRKNSERARSNFFPFLSFVCDLNLSLYAHGAHAKPHFFSFRLGFTEYHDLKCFLTTLYF